MGYGKHLRLKRIFGQDNRVLVLPIDHGVCLGDVNGLPDPAALLRASLDWGVDAHLATGATYLHAGTDVLSRNSPARLIACDAFYDEANVGHHVVFETVERALRLNVDAVKLLFFWGKSSSENANMVAAVTPFMREADKWDIPVILEPLLQPSVVADQRDKLSILSDGVRIAWELGADILKVGYPDDDDLLARWIQTLKVPTIMLGGPKSGTLRELVHEMDTALKIGVSGVAVGRKVWQRSSKDVPAVVGTIRDLVHGKISLQVALQNLEHIV